MGCESNNIKENLKSNKKSRGYGPSMGGANNIDRVFQIKAPGSLDGSL
jgi:hypothetical protein